MAVDSPEGRVGAVVAWLGEALRGHRPGATPLAHEVHDLTAAEHTSLMEALGQGEVVVRRGAAVAVRETRLPGVWCHLDGETAVRLEVGEWPTLALEETPQSAPELRLATPPADLMNGPAILAEIAQHQAGYLSGSEPHTINLSRLPVTPGDHAFLDAHLGEGEASVAVRGYGETRVAATRLPNVWRVRHYNASNQLLMDAIEVSDFPSVACATQEDIADSAVAVSKLLDRG